MLNSLILVSYARVKMKDAEYRIVVKFEGFCAANIPMMIGAAIPLHPRLRVKLKWVPLTLAALESGNMGDPSAITRIRRTRRRRLFLAAGSRISASH